MKISTPLDKLKSLAQNSGKLLDRLKQPLSSVWQFVRDFRAHVGSGKGKQPLPANTAGRNMLQDCDLAAVSLLGDRQRQEDRCLIARSPDYIFLLLADGIGGHARGDRAAEVLKKTGRELFLSDPAADGEVLFNNILTRSWDSLLQIWQQEKLDSRSTVVMARVSAGHAEWAYVGDSRLYLLSPDGGIWHTRDHSVAQLAALSGEISEEEISGHPGQSSLYRCVGGDKPPLPVFGKSDLALGTLLVLCSDGFWKSADFQAIYNSWREGDNLEKVILASARKVAEEAEADNTTALALGIKI